MVEIVYLSLGTNLGNRKSNLEIALKKLKESGLKILKKSGIYETEPLLVKDQPWFLNMAVEAESDYTPSELLEVCKKIEQKMGRKEGLRYGPRVIDIDILFYGNKVVSTEDLIIPHPRIAERRFVLVPLNEIAADFVHPGLKMTVEELLKECEDKGEIKKNII